MKLNVKNVVIQAVPVVSARHSQYLLSEPAPGWLNQIVEAAYSVSKDAAVGFTESLSITHGDEGIKMAVIRRQNALPYQCRTTVMVKALISFHV